MVMSGIPDSENTIRQTVTGGTPYGASNVATQRGKALSEDDISACQVVSKRMTTLSVRLNFDNN